MKINVKKVFGSIGAVILGLGGLVAAGKAGFGENLSFGKTGGDETPETPDATAPAAEPEAVEAEEVKTEPDGEGE